MRKFYVIIFSLCSLFLTDNLFAQTDSLAQNKGVKVSGIIKDSTSGQPVSAALVQLQEVQDKLLKYTETDKNGAFSFEDVPAGSYKVQVIKDNYDAFATTITVASENLSLDNILMGKDIKTEEIQVESQRPFMEIQDDKKIFNVANNVITQGKTAIDVLKTLPLVTVDGSDNVMLRGDARIKILVNGKENRMYNNLRQVPADLIEKIELITTPSAKYEAEGVTGIINIILKKNDAIGYTGMLQLGGKSDETFNTFGNINFKKEKSSLFVNLGVGEWYNKFRNDSKRTNFDPASTLISNSSGDNGGNWLWGSLGAEYDVTDKSVAGFEASINTWKGKNTNLTEQIYNSATDNYTYFYDNLSKFKGYNINSSFYFNTKFDTPDQELNLDFTYGRNDWRNNFDQEKEVTPAGVFRDGRVSKGNTFTAQVDYTHPLGNTLKLEAGYKGNFNLNKNNVVADSADNQLGTFVPDYGRTQDFNYDNFVNGFYATLSRTFGSFSAKLGGRVEMTRTRFDLGDPSNENLKEYTDFFPSAALTYKFGAMNSVQVSYSRRINRPPVWNLNPFIFNSNNQSFSFGNPALLPELTNSFEIGVNASVGGIMVSPNFYYRKTDDVITRYSYLSDTGTVISTFDNSSKLDSYGADLVFSGQLFGEASFNASLNFSKLMFTGPNGSSLDNEGTAFGGNAYLSIPLGQLATVEFFYNRWGDRVTAQGTNKGKNYLTIGLSRSFMNEKLRFNLTANDILAKAGTPESYSDGVGFTQTYINDWSSQNVNISLTYNFGNTQQPQNKRRKKRTETQSDQGTQN